MTSSAPTQRSRKQKFGFRSLVRILLNIGLSAKMSLLVVVGTVSMISLFAYLGTGALSESTQRNLQERVVLAQVTASYMDALLENIENVLTDAASDSDWFDAAHRRR